MQQEEQVQEVVSKAGGDPAKAVDALMKTGHPKAIELATKMKAMLPKPAEPYTLAPDAVRYDANNQPVSFGLPRSEPKPQNVSPLARLHAEKAALPPGDPRHKDYAAAILKETMGAGPAAATLTTAGKLDDAAIDDLAIQSLYDANALAGYRRDPKMMSVIANKRVKLMKDAGITSEDVVSGRAGFKADTASLNKITPQYDAITAFENTAIRNGKILVELANKVDTTGVPVAERWIRAGRKEIGGDADVAKFNAQMNLYRAEAARILTQPNLTGVLTDTARKEMEEVISNSATSKQITEVVSLLERDFGNRKHTLEEQIAAIRTRMRGRVAPGGGGAETPTTPVPTPTAPLSIEDRLKKYK